MTYRMDADKAIDDIKKQLATLDRKKTAILKKLEELAENAAQCKREEELMLDGPALVAPLRGATYYTATPLKVVEKKWSGWPEEYWLLQRGLIFRTAKAAEDADELAVAIIQMKIFVRNRFPHLDWSDGEQSKIILTWDNKLQKFGHLPARSTQYDFSILGGFVFKSVEDWNDFVVMFLPHLVKLVPTDKGE